MTTFLLILCLFLSLLQYSLCSQLFSYTTQIKRKLPRVNRLLAANLLEKDEAEKGDGEDNETKRKSKKKKGLGVELLKDGRFAAMFENKVRNGIQ